MKETVHSKTQIWLHLVWTTAHRAKLLTEAFWEWALQAVPASLDEEGYALRAVGGTADHVHVLARIRPDVKVSAVVSRLKGGWTFFMRRQGVGAEFKWQAGYGAFSVSPDGVEAVERYIRNQEERHGEGKVDEGLEPG